MSNSKAGANFYHRRGVPRDRLAVVYNGRDLDIYRDASSNSLGEELNIPVDAIVVCNVGRLVKRKGQYDLLDAWPMVSKNYPDAHCLLVGDGPERAAIEARVAALDRPETVHVVGTRDDVPAVLDLIDLFVFPSHHEGLPGALMEAMAAGLPIVATAIEGNTELISDGKTGVLVPPQDPSSLGTAVCSLLGDSDYASRLGAAAQADAYDRFSLDTMVRNFDQFYERIR